VEVVGHSPFLGVLGVITKPVMELDNSVSISIPSELSLSVSDPKMISLVFQLS
jgi:hypothetical protein